MIDAGSTSSKISILRWRDWPFRSNGWVEELIFEKVSPGISSYGKDSSQAFTHLKRNLNELMSTHIPENKRCNTAIYLGATAGMRLLKLESPLESEAILDDLRRKLPTIGVTLRNAYSDVRIISGSFEGRFAWVSTNYLAKKFGKLEIINPCLPTNYKMTIKKSEIFVEPCVVSKFAEKLVDSQLQPPTTLPEDIAFKGSWNFDECNNYIKRLFNSVTCNHSSCSFKGIYRPKLQGKYYAMSAFWFIFDFLKFPKNIQSVTAQQFEEKLKSNCNNEWDVMKQKYDINSLNFVSQNCFVGIYVHQLLINYGFSNDNKWKSITFVKKVAGGSVSWALGYIIDATGNIGSLSPKIRLPYPTFSVIIVILSIVLIAAIICLFLIKFKYSHKIDEENINF